MPIERIWLQVHDAEVRADEREKARAEAIYEFAEKMVIMMPGHKADILLIAERLKEGGK